MTSDFTKADKKIIRLMTREFIARYSDHEKPGVPQPQYQQYKNDLRHAMSILRKITSSTKGV